MTIFSLALQNFRSFKKASFEFAEKTTLIYGQNTAGKTNLLEAIYLLATGKSFRAETEKEMIGYEEEISRVSALVTNQQTIDDGKWRIGVEDRKSKIDNSNPLSNFNSQSRSSIVNHQSSNLEIILTIGQVNNQSAPHKKFLLNGVSKRMLDFVGNLRCVLFWPEDLELVTDSPSIRRKYLDGVLCQVDREYRRSLLIYEQGVRQRNKLLERIREEGVNRVQLLYWDKLLIKHGGVLTEKRGEYVEFINGRKTIDNGRWKMGVEDRKSKMDNSGPLSILNFQPRSSTFNNLSSNYYIEYDKSVISETRLEQYKNEEAGAGVTLVGPHRDNLKFMIRHSGERSDSRIKDGFWTSQNDEMKRDLSIYGSRGEQRLAIFWLKMAELEFVTAKTGGKPILLLDDIFSELDHEHRDYVLKIIPQQQTIMTTTDLHLIDKSYLKKAQIIEL